MRHAVALPGDIEPSFSRDLLALFRNQRHLRGFQPERDVDHLVRACAFEIEIGSDRRRERVDVCILNVPSVFSKMRRYSVGTGGRFNALTPTLVLDTRGGAPIFRPGVEPSGSAATDAEAEWNQMSYAARYFQKDYRVVGLVEGVDAETLVVMLHAAMSFCRLVWIGCRRRTIASSRAMSSCLAASPNSVIA